MEKSYFFFILKKDLPVAKANRTFVGIFTYLTLAFPASFSSSCILATTCIYPVQFRLSPAKVCTRNYYVIRHGEDVFFLTCYYADPVDFQGSVVCYFVEIEAMEASTSH